MKIIKFNLLVILLALILAVVYARPHASEDYSPELADMLGGFSFIATCKN